MYMLLFATELCLMSDTDGGFEVDGPAKKQLVGASVAPVHVSANSFLKQGNSNEIAG